MDKIRFRYVYIIRCEVRFEDGSQTDFGYNHRVYSSLRKAIDFLKFYKEIYTDEFLKYGYDVERDAEHYVDLREDGDYSFLNICNGVELTTYTINREILF